MIPGILEHFRLLYPHPPCRRLSTAGRDSRLASLAAFRIQSHGTFTRSGIVRLLESRRETRIEKLIRHSLANKWRSFLYLSSLERSLSLSILSRRERRTAARPVREPTTHRLSLIPRRTDRQRSRADPSRPRRFVIPFARTSRGPFLLATTAQRRRRLHRVPSDVEGRGTHALSQRFSKCPSGISVAVATTATASHEYSRHGAPSSSHSLLTTPRRRDFPQVQLAARSRADNVPSACRIRRYAIFSSSLRPGLRVPCDNQ